MTKGSGKRLSDAQRLEIIGFLSSPNPAKMRKLARDYNVNEKSIRNIKNNQEEIKKRIESATDLTNASTYRASYPKFPQLEDVLEEWLSASRRMSLVITPLILKIKAKQIAQTLGISQDVFSASDGWLQRFRKRRGIKITHLYGEGGEVDKDDPVLLKKLSDLEQLIDTYDIMNVYNMDETGLFYRMMPNYTLLMPDEDITTARGKKAQKERVTLTVCCNATGCHKISLQMIGKPQRPACIVGRQWPLGYHNQKRVS
jgi:hypothetical protein